MKKEILTEARASASTGWPQGGASTRRMPPYRYNRINHQTKDGSYVHYEVAPVPCQLGDYVSEVLSAIQARPDLRKRYFTWISWLLSHLIYHGGEAHVGKDLHIAMGAPHEDSQRKSILDALGTVVDRGGYYHGDAVNFGTCRLFRLTAQAVAMVNQATEFYVTIAEFEAPRRRPAPKKFSVTTFRERPLRLGTRIVLPETLIRVIKRLSRHGVWFDRQAALSDPAIRDDDALRTLVWRIPHGVNYARYRVARSGRLYSYEVHLQGLPKVLRKYVRPTKADRCFIFVDYASQEPRVFAHLSGDTKLQQVIDVGIYESLMASVPQLNRDEAKRVVCALIYGANANTLADDLKGEDKGTFVSDEKLAVLRQLAEAIVEWFMGFKEADGWKRRETARIVAEGQAVSALDRTARTKEGFDLTKSGTIRRGRKAKKHGGIGGAHSAGLNHLIQALCADILRRLLVALEEPLGELDACVALPIHDGLLIECPIERREEVGRVAKRLMEELPAEWLPGLRLPAEVTSWEKREPLPDDDDEVDMLTGS